MKTVPRASHNRNIFNAALLAVAASCLIGGFAFARFANAQPAAYTDRSEAVTNVTPTADAGPDQTVRVGATAVLDASRSTDRDGDRLAFHWTVVQRPGGSAAELSSRRSVRPYIKTDQPGAYVVRLVVGDGIEFSPPSSVTISTHNSRPVAHAGAHQTVRPGDRVSLDASNSTDVDSDALTFQWSMESAPAGSVAHLESANTAQPAFIADKPGTYIARVTVSDSAGNSASSEVAIDTENSRPMAMAGSDIAATVGETVRLDGRASADADGDPLTFRWALIAAPFGSLADIAAGDRAVASVTVDRAGQYVVQLQVDDGLRTATPDTVTIEAVERAPHAAKLPTVGYVDRLDRDPAIAGDRQAEYRAGLDSDSDGVPDDADNCILVPNGPLIPDAGGNSQLDADGDFFGNACDPDLNNDNVVNFTDLGLMKSVFFTADPIADLDGNAAVNFPDLAIMKAGFFGNPGPSGTLPALMCGVLNDAAINNAGEGHFYGLAGNAGDVVALTLVQTSGFGGSVARANVYSPSGQFLRTVDANSQQLITLPEDGNNVVVVRAANAVATGQYRIGLLCIDPPDPVAAALNCGDLLTSTIDEPGEADLYTFEGQAGDDFRITMIQTAGFGGSVVRGWLFDPSGNFVQFIDANVQGGVTLTQTGTYVFRVAAANLVATGTYRIGLICIDPPAPVGPPLQCGDLLTATIDEPGEADLYTFQGQAGDDFRITMIQTAGFGGSVVRGWLFDPSGVFLQTIDANVQGGVTLAETGTYVFRVAAANYLATGTYRVGLICIDPPAPVGPPLECGDLLTATIDEPGEADLYTFQGQAGDDFRLTMIQTAGFGGSVARGWLFSPTGAFVQTIDANVQGGVTLAETGTYVFRVAAANYLATGTYRVGLICIDPPAPVGPPLECGDLLTATIDEPGEADLYTFQGQAGDDFRVTMIQTDGFTGSVAQGWLFGPSGVFVQFITANTQDGVTLPVDGTYVFRVAAANYIATGTYRVGLTCIDPPAPVGPPLQCGDLVTATIDEPGEADLYTFQGQAGDDFRVTMIQTGGFAGSVVRGWLFDPSGNFVQFIDANAQGGVTLADAGTHVFRVAAANYLATGDYSVGLICIDPPAPVVAALTCGDLSAGAIDLPGEADLFTFEGTVGDDVAIELTQTGGFPGSVVSGWLFDPTGNFLLTIGANTQPVYSPTANGTYVIRLAAANYVAVGMYELGLTCP